MTTLVNTASPTAQEVLAIVQERLAPYQPPDDVMEVLPGAVHQEGRFWYVVVPASPGIHTASQYNRRVEKTERDLKKKDNLYVSILPVLPDWMDIQK